MFTRQNEQVHSAFGVDSIRRCFFLRLRALVGKDQEPPTEILIDYWSPKNQGAWQGYRELPNSLVTQPGGKVSCTSSHVAPEMIVWPPCAIPRSLAARLTVDP